MRPAEGLSIVAAWADGIRAPRTETIDLSPLINSLKFYKPLRGNPALFATVHLLEDGHAIAWSDDDAIDMAATSVERLAEEAMTAEDLRAFLSHQKLTHSGAAALLGYSRRQIELYLSGEQPIPRVVALACHAIKLRSARIVTGFISWGEPLDASRQKGAERHHA